MFYLCAVIDFTSIIHSDVNKILDVIGKSAYSTKSTIRNSYESACEVIQKKIYGDFVECGVASGAQVGAMFLALQTHKVSKKIWLFDSFEGIPLAGPNDFDQPGAGAIRHNVNVDPSQLLVSSNKVYIKELGRAACSSVDEVKSNLKKWGYSLKNMLFVKGWFKNTLPEAHAKIDAIFLLRLDGDLYESTKVCLEYLCPKLSEGGIVIIDDYALPGCKKACDEYFSKIGFEPKMISVAESGGVEFFYKI